MRAAEAALAHHHYVSAIDVLTGMGLLTPSNLQSWRTGRVDFLERVIQGNLSKISESMSLFRKWAAAKGLRPSETQYMRKGRSGKMDLQFSKSGDSGIEKNYRTHYVSPELSARKRENLEARLSRAEDPVVFQIRRESKCSECGTELFPGNMLMMEAEQPLCLPCAGRGDLEFLPAGDTALTRRSVKYSERHNVVVRFSRTRGRYERQGVLVEVAALEKAERECYEDADQRADQRVRAAQQRQHQDVVFVARLAEHIQVLFPGCPAEEARAIAEHTGERGSGRVGRSEAARMMDEQALMLAVGAAIRHRHTTYDKLLSRGVDRAFAREQVAGKVAEVRAAWLGPAGPLPARQMESRQTES